MKFPDIPIEDLEFSVHTANALKHEGIETLQQLREYDYARLKTIKGMGVCSAYEVISMVTYLVEQGSVENEYVAFIDMMAAALVGDCTVCPGCGYKGTSDIDTGCEYTCDWITGIRSPSSNATIDVYKAKNMALEWQVKRKRG